MSTLKTARAVVHLVKWYLVAAPCMSDNDINRLSDALENWAKKHPLN